jgi:hypothetical protein
MIDLDAEWFPFLDSSQFKELMDYFADPPEDIMIHQLAVSLGIEVSKSFAVFTVLHTKNILGVKLLIYHNCDPEMAVGAIPFGEGYPRLPFYCEECDSEVNDFSELDFDLMAIVDKG